MLGGSRLVVEGEGFWGMLQISQWGVLELILMWFAVTWCSSISGGLPGSFALTSLLAMVCVLWKVRVGSLGKMVDSSEFEIVLQCLRRVSLSVLVWCENVVWNCSGLSFWVGLGFWLDVVGLNGILVKVSLIRCCG